MKRQESTQINNTIEGIKYHIVTYGCQMNEHESQKIAARLEDMGFRHTAEKAEAGLIVLNTCCVRENAENKIIGNIGALKHLKEKNRSLKIVVCGCMTQQEAIAQKVYKTFPFVDLVLGTHNLGQLPQLLAQNMQEGKRRLELLAQPESVADEAAVSAATGPAAFANIMYGCNNYCSYCIVPTVRGPERSRKPERIIEEICRLLEQGAREVTLLGQNVNSYGKELGVTFAQLLERICKETPAERIRFMTSHPKDLSDGLIAAMARYPQIARHIHLPVQSGSTRILSLMNRKYTREEYLFLINKLRAAMPGITITTDIIVGFPGETEEDFAETISLVQNVRFEAAYTFVYSKRSGTVAAEMKEQIPQAVKKDRIVRLVALQNRITEEIDQSYVGSVQRVLVEGASTRSKKHVTGRADGGKTVNFAGDAAMIGNFINVRITQGKKTTLFGEAEGN